MPEPTDVKENSSTPQSALQEAIASSPEVIEEVQQTQETQTPAKEEETQEQTEQPEVQEEELRIPYSRFKEKVDETNWLKQQLEQQLQRQQPQQQPTQQEQELGNTPEEREFWRTQRRIAREEAQKVTREQMGNIQPVIDAGRMELAQIKVAQFRKDHPDIKPDSNEENAIAQRIQAGYTPDDAYWSVKGPQGIRLGQQQGKQQVKQQMEAKKKANVENTSSIPQQAQLKPKKTFKETFLDALRVEEAKT